MHPLSRPIAIFGGTFDPVHFGHLRTALELQQGLDLAEVRLVPCYQPVHKKPPTASAPHRLAMLRLAIRGEPALKIDDCEIQRQGPSYMIETLEAMHKKKPNVPLCLIMGMDALLGFIRWHRYQDILKLANLVVTHRPPYQLPKTGSLAQLLKRCLKTSSKALYESSAGHVLLHPVSPLDISASGIRRQIALDQNPRYLLPDSVYKYIQRHGVYGSHQI